MQAAAPVPKHFSPCSSSGQYSPTAINSMASSFSFQTARWEKETTYYVCYVDSNSRAQMAAGEPKRFSLPGPPRTSGMSGAITPRGTGSDAHGGMGSGPKRQSLYASTGGASSAKRPPPAGGCPPANAAKRARH
eukprot:1159973-Pelagomonas_calceolata.AAC.20